MPQWTKCPNCGEMRDTSNRYTSPQEQARITQWWADEHLSGACTTTPETPTNPDGHTMTLQDRKDAAILAARALAAREMSLQSIPWVNRLIDQVAEAAVEASDRVQAATQETAIQAWLEANTTRQFKVGHSLTEEPVGDVFATYEEAREAADRRTAVTDGELTYLPLSRRATAWTVATEKD